MNSKPCAAITCSNTNNNCTSWASVVAGRPGTEANLRPSKSRISSTQAKEPNCVRISTYRSEDHDSNNENIFRRYLPTDSANTYIRNALLNTSATKEVRVAGVGTTKTMYVIRFKDSQSAEIARANTDWLEGLGNVTKLVGKAADRLYFARIIPCQPSTCRDNQADY